MTKLEYYLSLIRLVESEIKEYDEKLAPLYKKRDKIDKKINKINSQKSYLEQRCCDYKESIKHEEILDVKEILEKMEAKTFFHRFGKIIKNKIKEYYESN